MKNQQLMIVFTAVLIMLSPSMISYADGGGPDPSISGCDNIPEPDYDGPLIQGTFIAAYDNFRCAEENPKCRHYNIHVMLEGMKMTKGRQVPYKRLYTINREIRLEDKSGSPKNLCDYLPYEFKYKYNNSACNKRVADHFEYNARCYYPVLTDVTITQKDDCHDYKKAKVAGTLTIRMTHRPDNCH